MIRIRKLAAALTALLLCAGAATAGLESFSGRMVDIEYWTGTGTQRAVLVIDFGPGVSYAFGYRFSGTRTGLDMLQAVSEAGGLSYTHNTEYGAPFVDSITYKGRTMGAYWGYPNNWLCYYIGSNGSSWTFSFVGAADRPLADGDWDGWANARSDAFPPTAIPDAPPQRATLMQGTEKTVFGVVAASNGRSTRLRPSERDATLVVYHNRPADDSTLRVCGMELSSAKVSGEMLPGLTLNINAATTFNGTLREQIGDDTLLGRLQGTLDGDDLDTLDGLLLSIERATTGRLSGLFLYTWAFERAAVN
jgi:hypothetical protein